MKSLQVLNFDSANAHMYSELRVLQSGAGFYIGTSYSYTDPDFPDVTIDEPGSRDTNYFLTKELAEAALALMEKYVMPNGKLDAGAWSVHATSELKIACIYRFNP